MEPDQGRLQEDRSILVVGMLGKVFGLDRATGEVRWRRELGGEDHVTVGIGHGIVAAVTRGYLHCLDYVTGRLRWRKPTANAGRATLLIEEDSIVCATNGYVDAFAPDGTKRWMQPLSGEGQGRAAIGFPGNVMQADDAGSE